jgi:tetratricopeptide (TPR) repeat protein
MLGARLLAAQDAFVLAYFPPFGSNDAVGFYRSGESNIKGSPHFADEQFMWAARLDPMWALPIYGRAVAQERIWFRDFMDAAYRGEGPKEPGRAEFHLLDSLIFTALTHDPFFDRRIDRLLAEGKERTLHLRVRLGSKKVNLPDEVPLGEAEFLERDYVGATENWGKALKEMPDLLPLRTWRAEAFYQLKKYDSAIVELRALAEALTTKEQQELVYEFQSKAIAVYSIGVLQVQLNDLPSARASFEEALNTDLGLYMAHVRLAGLNLLAGDTTTAVTELGAATQLNDTDAAILFQYGYVLIAAGRDEEAIAELRRAIAVDPYFATPYQYLGRVLDARGRTKEAVAAYQGYVDHAPPDADDFMWIVQRIVELSRTAASKH